MRPPALRAAYFASIASGVLVGALAATACSSEGGGAVSEESCAPRSPASCPSPAPQYVDVAPIFAAKCNNAGCHDGRDEGPWPLATYEDVVHWRLEVLESLQSCSMPPRNAGVALTTEEQDLLFAWLVCGAPE